MVRRFLNFFLCLMIFIGILACITTPKFEFPRGTRVGIINLLESHATHKNLSSFATENFTKTYQVGWDIPLYAENQLITQLEKDMVFLPENVSSSIQEFLPPVRTFNIDLKEKCVLSIGSSKIFSL